MRAKRRERKRNIGVGVAKFNIRVARMQDRCKVGGGKLRRGQGARSKGGGTTMQGTNGKFVDGGASKRGDVEARNNAGRQGRGCRQCGCRRKEERLKRGREGG